MYPFLLSKASWTSLRCITAQLFGMTRHCVIWLFLCWLRVSPACIELHFWCIHSWYFYCLSSHWPAPLCTLSSFVLHCNNKMNISNIYWEVSLKPHCCSFLRCQMVPSLPHSYGFSAPTLFFIHPPHRLLKCKLISSCTHRNGCCCLHCGQFNVSCESCCFWEYASPSPVLFFFHVISYSRTPSSPRVNGSFPSTLQPRKESRLFPALVVSRVVFIPLLMLCNVQPRKFLPVYFSHDALFTTIMAVFSVSSGYFVCLSMTYAPQWVQRAWLRFL